MSSCQASTKFFSRIPIATKNGSKAFLGTTQCKIVDCCNCFQNFKMDESIMLLMKTISQMRQEIKQKKLKLQNIIQGCFTSWVKNVTIWVEIEFPRTRVLYGCFPRNSRINVDIFDNSTLGMLIQLPQEGMPKRDMMWIECKLQVPITSIKWDLILTKQTMNCCLIWLQMWAPIRSIKWHFLIAS